MMKKCRHCGKKPRRKEIDFSIAFGSYSCSDWNCKGYEYWATPKQWNYWNRKA